MTLEVINDRSLWDEFIDKSPHGLLFHRWDFLKIVERHTGYALLPYGWYKGNELICVFPIFYKKINGLKMVFSPPPKTAIPHLGPVMGMGYNGFKQRKKEVYMNAMVEEIDRELSKLSPNYISISMAPGFMDIRPFKWCNYDVASHFSYTLDLDRPAGQIWDGFSKDCRSNMKKCMHGSICLEQTLESGTFYDIMNDRYGQQGLTLPIVSREYLADIVSAFPDNIKIFFVKSGPDIRDIELTCEYKDSFKLWLGGATIQKGVSGYQEYATWELIKMAQAKGYKKFEIAGAGVKRICAFQSKFNPQLELSFSVNRADRFGRIAEWAYVNFVKRRWVKTSN